MSGYLITDPVLKVPHFLNAKPKQPLSTILVKYNHRIKIKTRKLGGNFRDCQVYNQQPSFSKRLKTSKIAKKPNKMRVAKPYTIFLELDDLLSLSYNYGHLANDILFPE